MSVNVNQVGFERRQAVVQQLLHGLGLQVGDRCRRAVTAPILTEHLSLPRADLQHLDPGVR